jgi:hypothetical protein
MKFGAESEEFTIGKTRWGLCHIIKTGAEGRLVHCRRNPATCKYCHEHGVPQNEPDPFDVACELLRANWGRRWVESDRQSGTLGQDEIWPADGLHIVAVDDESRAKTILCSFGDNHPAMGAISALVHVHNEMIGRPDL